MRTIRIRKPLLILCLLALIPFAISACGGDDESSSSDSSSESSSGSGLTITADPDGAFAFESDTAEASAGETEVTFENPAQLGHDLVIEDEGGREVGRTEVIVADTDSFTADLQAGEYTFYCSVGSHRASGMEGTLSVE
ncbi:MAG: hypothetical protein H0W09_02680 [Solirubrobacterales bacterium]|nr:hypothetical protein [Solirubrobacterales bacterium]